MSNAMKGAFGAYSATEIEALGASYGALAGPVVRQGMIHSRRNNMGYAGADCGCGDLALTNPAEGEESWIMKNKWWLIGAGVAAVIAKKQGMF